MNISCFSCCEKGDLIQFLLLLRTVNKVQFSMMEQGHQQVEFPALSTILRSDCQLPMKPESVCECRRVEKCWNHRQSD